MSAFENVVIGKLKLKGKPLDVKSSGSQKKKNTKRYSFSSAVAAAAAAGGENAADSEGFTQDDNLTSAERMYLEQMEKLGLKRLILVSGCMHMFVSHAAWSENMLMT